MKLEYWIIIIFPVVFVVFWSFIVWLLSLIGGWSRLAKVYSTKDTLNDYQGKKLRGKHGRLGMTSYSGVLVFGANMQGMYLAVNPFFRVGHPPLYIPWHDIQIEEQDRMLMSYTTLTFAQVPTVKLRLPAKVIADVQALKTGNFF